MALGKINFTDILGGTIQGGNVLLNTIKGAKQMADLPEDSYQSDIDNLKSTQLNSGSLEDLMAKFNATKLARTDFTTEDLLGMTGGEAAGQILGNGLSGAFEGGLAFGPFGMLKGIGDIVASSIGYGIRKERASNKAAQLNYAGDIANREFVDKMQKSVMDIGKNETNMGWLNRMAIGGPLDTTFTNGVRTITEGSTHEQNPNGGVPQGIATDGLPNLVEEGEVVYNDYVYSDRLKVPNSYKEMLGLKKDKDYTFAEAATQIQKESEERPNDPISKRNLDEMMGRLQGVQEEYKAKREQQQLKRAVNSMTPDELAMFIQQLQYPQQMQPMLAMQGMQPMQPTQSEVPVFGKGGLLGHKHAGPFSLSFLNTPTSFNFAPTTNQDVLDLYENTYGFKPGFKVAEEADLAERIGKVRKAANLPQDRYVPKTTTSSKTDTEKNSNFSFAQALRAAPVIGSFASTLASLFDKPNYANIERAEKAVAAVPRVRAGHVGQRMPYNPIDTNFVATQIANQGIGARRALNEVGAGPQSIIAGNYSNQLAQAQALMQAKQTNTANLLQALDFNRGTDATNIGNDLQAALANQQRDMNAAQFLLNTGQLRNAELAQLQANRSTNLSNTLSLVGGLGQDWLNRDFASAMAESYGVPYNDVIRALQNTYYACGGKLNTKKGGKHA